MQNIKERSAAKNYSINIITVGPNYTYVGENTHEYLFNKSILTEW